MIGKERVEHIVGMMTRDEWVRGESAEQLADEWGLHIKTVERYSAEASRRVRAQLSDEDFKGQIIERLDSLSDLAKDDGAWQPAINALWKMFEARGLAAPQRVEVAFERLGRMTIEEKALAVLADPQLGPVVRRFVLRETGLNERLLETHGEEVSDG